MEASSIHARMQFVGREPEFLLLTRLLDQVRESRRGVLVAVRGRRQVGKSTLVEQFVEQARVPSVFFAASRGVPAEVERNAFAELVAQSELGGSDRFQGVTFADWRGLLRTLADAVTGPSVVVVDELPWLLEGDPVLEGVLQSVWDRQLSKGSRDADRHRVRGGDDGGARELRRPLYGRMREVAVEPLTVAETADMLGLDATRAFDAQLVTGGYPRLLADWPRGGRRSRFLREQLADATSPLVVVGERMLNAEFPIGLQARDVLVAVGAGETGFLRLRDRSGLNQGSLARTLRTLVDEARVLRAERPLSARPSRLVRYVVADPYLRFWLRLLLPAYERVLRGRGESVAEEIEAAWPDWRGRAFQPLVRASNRALAARRPARGGPGCGGGWWDRRDEVDLVGTGQEYAPASVAFVGSVKWRDRRAFDRADLLALAQARSRVRGRKTRDSSA